MVVPSSHSATSASRNFFTHSSGSFAPTYRDRAADYHSIVDFFTNTPSRLLGTGVRAIDALTNIVDTISGAAGTGGGGGSASSVAQSAFKTDADGSVSFADPNLQSSMDLINQTAQANNNWSALQAERQMEFQKMMSDTAHQREVADLQKAGLNPVLSAGGSGASTPNGAMAQVDQSNTRLIGELAFAALDAVQNTAVGVASRKNVFDTPFGRSLGSGLGRGIGYAISRGLTSLLF